MAENPEEVITDSTETIESSTAASETGETETTTEPQQPRKSLRDMFKEDPALEAEFNLERQRDLARARTRWQRQQLRATATKAAESENADAAMDVARLIAAEPDEPDEGEAADAHWSQAAERVQPQLERMLQLDAEGRASNKYYVALHQREGKPAMDKRYAEDPVAFVNWVDDQIMEMRVDEKVKKVAPSLASAMATDEAHARLRGQTPPIGGSASAGGALTLEAYERMTFDERQKLRKDNPRVIDEMITRAGR